MNHNIIWNTPQFLRSAHYYKNSLLPSNVREEGDSLVLEVIVSGVKREQIQIQVDDENCLDIQVQNQKEKQTEQRDEDPQYLSREFGLESRQRRFQLGKNLDPQSIEASLEDGILRVRIAKKAPEKRNIAIA